MHFFRTYAALAAQPGLLEHIDGVAEAEGINSALMLGILTEESQGNPEAISVTGAAGIAQFLRHRSRLLCRRRANYCLLYKGASSR